MLSQAFIIFWWSSSIVAAERDFPTPYAEDKKTMAFFINKTTDFRLPSGFLHIRVLAVGGGGAGCRKTAMAIGQASVPVVDILDIPGERTINITVGSGGTNQKESTSSQFGKYLVSKGGKGCATDFTTVSLDLIKGIDKFRLSKITKGQDGKVGDENAHSGGQGGVLINGEGPSALPGSNEGSGQGGRGFGAGGGLNANGSRGKAFSRGGDGAPGLVYFEVSTGCDEDVQIMMAIESIDDRKAFWRQLEYVNFIFSAINDPNLHEKVGLVVYRNNVNWVFMPRQHKSLAAMKNATTSATRLIEDHSVSFRILFDKASKFFGEKNSTKKRSLVIFTHCPRRQSFSKEYYKKLLALRVSIIVVNASLESDSCNTGILTGDKNHVFNITNDKELKRWTPWIVDLICAGRTFSPTATSTVIRPTELSRESTVTSNALTIEPSSITSVRYSVPLSTSRLNMVFRTVTTVISPRISFSFSSVLANIVPTTVKAGYDSFILKTKTITSVTPTPRVLSFSAIRPSRVNETANTASLPFKQITDPICVRPKDFPADPYTFPVNCTGLMGNYTDNVIPEEILFMEYNMNEAGYWSEVVEKIQTNFTTPPSVIFISEIDRGCYDTGKHFIIEDMAKELKMDYAYVPEFLEWRQSDGECTTGNGILSKFPLESMEYILFEKQCCWFSGRLGGRSGLTVQTTIKGKPVTLATTHLESGTDLDNQLDSEFTRTLQAAQLGKATGRGTRFLAGDMNDPFYSLSPTAIAYYLHGFEDSFWDVPVWKRSTTYSDHDFCLDYMFTSIGCLREPYVGNAEEWEGLSDHRPIFATLDLDCFLEEVN